MALPAERIPTFDELYRAIQALPEGITGEILSDGVIETMGRPGRPHTRFARKLGGFLGATVETIDESSGWVIEPEREVRFLASRLLVPDLAGWRIVEGDTAFLDDNPVLRRPDWACEIVSDSTRRRDRAEKLPLYLQAGVPFVWIVEPESKLVEVFASDGAGPVRVAVARGDEPARLPPFDLDLPLATLWVPGR